jgi:hypothetical protein
MEDMDYTKVKNKVNKPEKRVAKEKVPELPSDEQLRVQISTNSNRKKKQETLKRWRKAE